MGANPQPRQYRGVVRNGNGADGKVGDHNRDRKEEQHLVQIVGGGKELKCIIYEAWAPSRAMAAFLQERCTQDEEADETP